MKTKFEQALSDLVLIHPFWGYLALNFDIEATDKVETFQTNGRTMQYNPKVSNSMSVPVNMFAIAHECAHVMLHHLSRPFNPCPGDGKVYGHKDGKPVFWHHPTYFVAGDFIINDMLVKSGFSKWDKCLHDKRFDSDKMTTEEVYRILLKENPPQQCNGNCDPNGQGTPDNNSGQCNCPGKLPQDGIMGKDHVDPNTGGKKEEEKGFTEQEVRDMVQRAAAAAKQQGKLPANLEGIIKEAMEPQYPVYQLLERFVDSSMASDNESWRKPLRQLFPYGIVMPGPDVTETISHVVVCIDTSGSVPDDDIARFLRIAGDILRRAKPNKLSLIECDAQVHSFKDFMKPSEWTREHKTIGRGGTSFVPPFTELQKRRIVPTCLVYLTDLYGDFPKQPSYPVLWVSTTKDHKAPFGMTIHLNQ